MEIKPILSTLMRNKTGVFVIAAQVALTLAIVANVFYIVRDRLDEANRPSGVDEDNTFMIRVGAYRPVTDPFADADRDLAALRAIPGVIQVAEANQMPLSQSGNNSGVSAARGQQQISSSAAFYESGDSLIDALGLKLVAGRDFTAADIVRINPGEPGPEGPFPIIVTQALIDKVFPGEQQPIGKSLYLGTGPNADEMRIVGVVDALTTPWGRASWGLSNAGNVSMIAPFRRGSDSPLYIVRTEPGALDGVMKTAEALLVKPGNGRVLGNNSSMNELRERRYRSDRFLVGLMGTMTGLLLVVTASGILGMASLWVNQRRKQIGVRRALGATRFDIVRYYLTENFIVTGIGIVIGVGLAFALNAMVASELGLERLPLQHLVIGIVLLWVIGQIAAYAPARRASQIAPATATRSV